MILPMKPLRVALMLEHNTFNETIVSMKKQKWKRFDNQPEQQLRKGVMLRCLCYLFLRRSLNFILRSTEHGNMEKNWLIGDLHRCWIGVKQELESLDTLRKDGKLQNDLLYMWIMRSNVSIVAYQKQESSFVFGIHRARSSNECWTMVCLGHSLAPNVTAPVSKA